MGEPRGNSVLTTGRVRTGMASRVGFPANLLVLCTSVAFERAAYYGLQSILALYLAELLVGEQGAEGIWLLPSLAAVMGTQGLALAGVITGAFVSMAVLAPAIGGIVADRFIGLHRAILVGGAMMTAGHGLLILEAALLPALAMIALGAGFFKGPVAARLSGLYEQDDPLRVEGFRLFYLAINIAGLLAPLVIGTLGERVHWHAGFAVSCALMLAGLAIYGWRFAGSDGDKEQELSGVELTSESRSTDFLGLGILSLSLALLTVPNAQLANAYLLWVNEGFSRTLLGWELPASWIIAADGLLSLFALAASGMFWRWRERNGEVVTAEAKAMLGALAVVGGVTLLVMAALLYGRSEVPVVWGLCFQFLNSLGLANVLPAAMAIFGQATIRRHAATAMAGFYLSLFAGGVASTWLASQFTTLAIATFWQLHLLFTLGGGLGLFLFRSHRSRLHTGSIVAD